MNNQIIISDTCKFLKNKSIRSEIKKNLIQALNLYFKFKRNY